MKIEEFVKQEEYWKTDRWLSLDDFDGEEEWKPVVGHEDYFLISSYGRVKSVNRVIDGRWGSQLRRGKIIKTKQESTGYLSSAICVNGKINTYKVHRLVGIAFVNNPLEKPQIDHIDGNKANNLHSNVRWTTSSENNLFKFEKIDTTSEYHGVNYDRCADVWVARIRVNGERYHIGRFEREIDAHLAYEDVFENGLGCIQKYHKDKECKFNIVPLKNCGKWQIRKKVNKKLKAVCTLGCLSLAKRIKECLNTSDMSIEDAVELADLIKREVMKT